ncbi:bifunctional diguanylate cyclase/phosphodiesterase [Noviherbaspirillum massiliense]|uniref:bifunctional diguanylate cyclase/phosphodiesterase n=1 Tax=Noviherbaspirillum massiliense TaxID=1465823 RepID=UPI0002EFEABA|nr:EAL domain-containing protein [Noviherbaspirillum massiliense]
MLKFSRDNISKSRRHSRLAVGLFVLLALATLAIGIETYQRLVADEEQQARNNLNQIADIQASAVSAWVNERLSDAEIFSSGRFLGETMDAWVKRGEPWNDPVRRELLDQLQIIRKAYGYRDAAIISARGGTWISTQATGMPGNPVARQAARQALDTGSIEVSDIYSLPGATEEERVVDIVAPLYTTPEREGEAPFALILRANADLHLDPNIQSLSLLDASAALLVEIRDRQVAAISDSTRSANFRFMDVLPISVEDFLAALQTPTSPLVLKTGTDRKALSVVRRIGNVPWYLVAMIDQASIRANLDRLAWMVATAIAGLLALAGITLFLWWKKAESDYRLQAVQAESDKKLLQRQYSYLSRYANDMIILADARGHIININDKALQAVQHERDEVVGQPLETLFLPFCRSRLQETLSSLDRQGAAVFEVSQQHADGAVVPVEVSARNFELDGRRFIHLICRDISERKQAEAALRKSQERLNAILESILDVVWSFSTDLSRVNYINRSVERMLGYSVAECMSKPQLLFGAIHPEDWPEIERSLRGLSREHPSEEHEFRMFRKDGKEIWTHCRSNLVVDGHGFPLRIDGVTTDITQRKQAEQQVQELAYYDNVTSLPNRALLTDRLKQAIQMAMRSHKKVAVLYMDLDNFKNVNDSLGHHVGDQLLRSIAERLLQCVRGEDTVARIGGDEFLIVLPDIDRSEQAVAVAEKILAAIAKPFALQEHQVHTSISIGISVHPDDGLEPHDLIRYADSALYQAKSQGRNNYQFFTQELNHQIVRGLMIERQLRHAIEHGELSLWYQPQIDAQDGHLIGAEALLRWRHGDRDFLSPVEFIPVAEERGLISKIGEWVLREACRQCRTWQLQGLRPVPVAVNVSPLQFQQKEFATLVTSVLKETRLEPAYLELEITESSIMRRAPLVAELAMRLRDAGVGISIDDFGTGYSSLSYLKQIPIDKIKIDRSFISDMLHDVDSESITYAIINLAHSLNLRVIAEGVESRAQMERLRSFGCNEIQGNYYSSAVSADTFQAFLANETRVMTPQLVQH